MNCLTRYSVPAARMAKTKYLHIGGLVAVGFDSTGEYMIAVSHSGRGVFSTSTWDRVARDRELAYLIGRIAVGIGPVEGQSIAVNELDSDHPIRLTSPDGSYNLECTSSEIAISESATHN